MSATDFDDVVTAAGLAVPSTIVRVAGVGESLVPSVAMNAPSARAAPIAAEATSAAARDACFMGGLLGRCRTSFLLAGCSSELRPGSESLVSRLRDQGYHRRMAAAATPIDDEGTVDIDDAPGWRYLPFVGSDDAIEVTVVRDGDGCELRFTVPAVVQRGAELGRIARIVIAAQERADRSEGLGA